MPACCLLSCWKVFAQKYSEISFIPVTGISAYTRGTGGVSLMLRGIDRLPSGLYYSYGAGLSVTGTRGLVRASDMSSDQHLMFQVPLGVGYRYEDEHYVFSAGGDLLLGINMSDVPKKVSAGGGPVLMAGLKLSQRLVIGLQAKATWFENPEGTGAYDYALLGGGLTLNLINWTGPGKQFPYRRRLAK